MKKRLFTLFLMILAYTGAQASEAQVKTGAEPTAASAQAPKFVNVYIDWMETVVPMESEKLQYWLSLKQKKNDGKELITMYRYNLQAYQFFTDKECAEWRAKRVKENNDKALLTLHHKAFDLYELVTDTECEEYYKKNPKPSTKVRFYNPDGTIANRDLSRFEFLIYQRDMMMRNGKKPCQIYRNTDGSVESFTDKQVAHLAKTQPVLIRQYHNNKISNRYFSRKDYAKYIEAKKKQNNGKSCKRIDHTDGSVEYMTDAEYVQYKSAAQKTAKK